MKKLKLQNKDYLVTDDISGRAFAVLGKGENQLERLETAIKEEHCCDDFEVSDIDTIDGIGFTINSEADGVKAHIKLLTAHIY